MNQTFARRFRQPNLNRLRSLSTPFVAGLNRSTFLEKEGRLQRIKNTRRDTRFAQRVSPENGPINLSQYTYEHALSFQFICSSSRSRGRGQYRARPNHPLSVWDENVNAASCRDVSKLCSKNHKRISEINLRSIHTHTYTHVVDVTSSESKNPVQRDGSRETRRR